MPIATAPRKEGAGLMGTSDFYTKKMLSAGFRERPNLIGIGRSH